MKFLTKVWIIAGSLSLMMVGAYAAPQNYTLDPMHTTVSWHVNHLGFSNFSGKYFATGTMLFDESKPVNSKVTVVIRIESGVTGLTELDKHIAGNAFLDYHKYPTATFVSKKVTMTGIKTADVRGDLTIHGVSLPVTLKVVFNRVGLDKITNKQTAGFSATTAISRSDYGVKIFVPDVGDDVTLDIEVEATLDGKVK